MDSFSGSTIPLDRQFEDAANRTAALVEQASLNAKRAEYRIEALRAASRVVGGAVGKTKSAQGFQDIEDNTLALAEQFAKWLEGG